MVIIIRKNHAVYFLTAGLLVYLLTHTDEYVGSSLAAIENCIHSVIPSLFCYIVLTKLMVSSGGAFAISRPFGKLFHSMTGLPSGCAGVYILSFISGFPSGVIGVKELHKMGYIDKRIAEKLCAICNNTGPALPCLMIGRVVFGSIKTGAAIYLTQILSSVMLCLIFRKNRDNIEFDRTVGGDDILKNIVDSVEGSVAGIANMCGYMIIFSVVGHVFCELPVAEHGIKLVMPFFEIVSGCMALSGENRYVSYIISSAALSFGGLCVHMQAAGACIGLGISLKAHFFFKLLHGLLSALLAALTVIIFKESIF